jgi:hypothetical protein
MSERRVYPHPKATADTFILDRLKAGIALYHARRDTPHGRRERAMWQGRAARLG